MLWRRCLLPAVLFGSLLFFLTGTCFASSGQEKTTTDSLAVTEIAICDSVVNRAPIGAKEVFEQPVEKLYCFTKIEGCPDTTFVNHVWYHKDKEMASVKLSVKSRRWRTWSSKKIMKDWTGKWRVDIVSPEDKVLKSISFEIKEQPQ